MNILFLTISRINDITQRGIYTDLLRELVYKGHEIYVTSPAERRFGEKTQLLSQCLPLTTDNRKSIPIQILKVKTLNIQKTNVIEKGIGTLLLERQFLKAIEKYWGNVKFDLIIYSTPPITFNKVIETLKNRYKAKSYLLLKDIFPQNAVDLGMFAKDSFFYKLFRKKEEKLYSLSDRIGTMSPANSAFLLEHNCNVSPSKVEVFPNSLIPLPLQPLTKSDRDEILNSLGIDSNKVVSIYGGNLGRPQGVDFLLDVVKENENKPNHHILIIGDGTEYPKIHSWFSENSPKNATLVKRLPKKEYDKLVKAADIGLIFLDHRFTIPNYPSRLLSYLENAIPVMIASDPNTDIGRMAEEEGYGFWSESNNVSDFFTKIDKMISDSKLRHEMGNRGRAYFEKNLDVRKHIDKIIKLKAL